MLAAPPPSPRLFADWCQQRKILPLKTAETIAPILTKLGTTNCQQAQAQLQTAAAQVGTDAKIPGVAAPACAEESQLALNRCAVNWSKTADFLRSLIYQDLYEQLSEPMQVKLKAIEQTWQAYRETHCQELGQPFQDGSMYPLIHHNCLANLTNDRIAELQSLGEITLTPKAIAQRLSIVLHQANLQNSASQRLWQRYQEQHCQFETWRLAARPQTQQCQQQLQINRIRHIEQMMELR